VSRDKPLNSYQTLSLMCNPNNNHNNNRLNTVHTLCFCLSIKFIAYCLSSVWSSRQCALNSSHHCHQ